MRSKSILVVVVLLLPVVNIALADIVRGIDIDFVTIGNPGNPGDTRAEANPSGCGAVSYEYQIGKYEVTNAQWNDFVAAVGAPTGNPSDAYDQNATYTGAQQPTNMVSWYEALQFCNYLTTGDKSQGVYQFSGNNTNPGDFVGIDRTAAETTYGTIYFLPTEDEWYKAAYYKPDDSSYSLYANGTDTAPIANVESKYEDFSGSPWDVHTGTEEQNGTFDMMGNVFEWNELINGPYRGLRGGSFYSYGGSSLGSSGRDFNPTNYPNFEDESFGFRVASIPEPAMLFLLGFGAVMIRRK